MKKTVLWFLLLLMIFVMITSSNACTIFSAAQGDTVLAGNNEDYNNLKTRVWFFPPSGQRYGRVGFGAVAGTINRIEGGMNDQGLFWDYASLLERSVPKNYSNKPVCENIIRKMNEECATVEEAIELFTKYYYPYLWGHIMIADKLGNSVIIEWGEKDLVFIRKEGNYQVVTNFPISDTANARWYNCYRYKVANSMLKNSNEISIDLFRSILDAVHFEGISTTIYSNIYDLKKGEVYVYNFHNFNEVVKFNLEEELKKGEHLYQLPQLFHQIKLRFPISGEQVDPLSVTFIWDGDAENYYFYYSVDPNFTDCEPIEIASVQMRGDRDISLCFLCLGMLLIGGILPRQQKIVAMFACLIIFCIFLSCGLPTPPAPSKIEHSNTIENLQPNTTYYWKVVAIGEDGINSESTVESFITGE